MIDRIIIALYDLVVRASQREPKESATVEGFRFEEETAKTIYELIRGLNLGVDVLPYRSYLSYPTFSGLKHQFDDMFRDRRNIYLVECKKREFTPIDQILSFNSKIVDYALGTKLFNVNLEMKGIFFSTSRLTDNALQYSFGFGLIPIEPSTPPIEYMISKIERTSPLKKRLEELNKEISATHPATLFSEKPRNAKEMLKRYRYYLQLWSREKRE